MSRRRILGCGLAASLVALALLTLPGLVAALDRRVYDLLLRVAGPGEPSGRVAIVAVDRSALAAHGPWPWSPPLLARLLQRITAAGAAAIALDTVLQVPDAVGDSGLDEHDGTDALVDVLHRSRVVLGHAMTFVSAPTPQVPCVVLPIERDPSDGSVPLVDLALGPRLFHASGVECSAPELTGAAAASGYLNLGPDGDGVLRRAPLVMAYRNGTVPSLAAAAVHVLVGHGPLRIGETHGYPLTLELGGLPTVPLDDHGTVALRFREEGAFPRVSALDVLDSRPTAAVLANRLVFVGSDVSDAVATPVTGEHPRLNLHATAADNLLQRDFISSPPYARLVTVILTLLLGPSVAGLIVWLGYQRGVIGAFAIGVGLWIAAVVAMRVGGVFVSPVLPMLAAVGAAGLTATWRITRERFRSDDEQRRRQQAQELLVQSLMTMVELRDPTTGQHARRTQGYCRLLAQRLAHTPGFREYLTQERIEYISWLAPLHDIGKVGVRDAVLGKPSALSAEELDDMRRHPMVGFEAITRAQRHVGMDSAHDDALLQIAKDIVYTHHERWDGTGYPRGLRGDEIPITGRIVAVVDVYDALVEARPYRRRIPHQEAVTAIVSGRGTQFDPAVVDAFLMVEKDILELGTRLREEVVQG